MISVTVLSTLHLLFEGFVGPKESGEVFTQRDGDEEGGGAGWCPFLHTSLTTLILPTAVEVS